MENNKLLLIIDPQNDFISGSLAVKNANTIITPICEWITIAKQRQFDIAVTRDFHPTDHCSFTIFPPHCVAGTEGAEIEENILNTLGDYPYTEILKGQDSSVEEFSGIKYLKEVLDLSTYSEIIVCGIAGDYCVHDSVQELCELGYCSKITVDTTSVMSIDGGTKLLSLLQSKQLRYTE